MTSITSMPTARPRRRRARRAFAIVFLGGTLLSTVGFWLASSGSFSSTISPPAGLSDSNGAIASVAAMTNATATGAGSGNSIEGVPVERIRIAKTFTAASHISVAWLDPQDANQVLNNPNAQLQFTLYHPVAISNSAAPASGGNSSCSSITNAIKITDGAATYCALADTSATGSATVSGGALFLSHSLFVGYLVPSEDGSGADAACSNGDPSPVTWCQIPSTSLDGGNGYDASSQRTMWLVATIDVPGNAPKGQQAQAGSLQFYVKATSAA